MKARWLAGLILFGFFSGTSLAHGNKVHVRGTIEKVTADSIQVKTPDGKSAEVKLTASTVYLLHVAEKPVKPSDVSNDQPAKVTDLAVGDLVVIHATPKGDTLEADEVRFSVPNANKAAPPSAQKPKT
ncbi:MAG TPA: hypothetical protein VEI73_15185 [Candidatus Acidoferrum sp.]|nr:hypothetical protein [Candidatus Acidoferrum sp.]